MTPLAFLARGWARLCDRLDLATPIERRLFVAGLLAFGTVLGALAEAALRVAEALAVWGPEA